MRIHRAQQQLLLHLLCPTLLPPFIALLPLTPQSASPSMSTAPRRLPPRTSSQPSAGGDDDADQLNAAQTAEEILEQASGSDSVVEICSDGRDSDRLRTSPVLLQSQIRIRNRTVA